MTNAAMDPIYRNHLQFFRRHRGDFIATENEVFVTSEVAEVAAWTPLASDVAIPAAFDAVRLVPESGPGWDGKLEAAGYEPAEALSYQELVDLTLASPVEPDPAIAIRRAESVADADVFAAIQIAGFLDPHCEDEDDRWWREFLFPFVARRNVFDTGQDMLIARHHGEEAAVLLLVHTPGVAGIYAVATRPEFRNRGLSRALLAQGVTVARARGATRLVLQAMQGSYADGFYKRQGFVERYVSQVWRR